MPLYVANCTVQHFRHSYRQPETGRIVVVDIPSGRQVEMESISARMPMIIEHLERYGAVEAKEVSHNMKDFDGILYSTVKPIPADKIQVGHEAVVEKNEKRSATEAVRSALALDSASRDKKTRKRLAKVSQVEVIQDTNPKEKPTGKEIKMNISVANDGAEKSNIPR